MNSAHTSLRRRLGRPRGAILSVWLVLALGACEPGDPLEAIRQRQATGDFAGTIEPLRALLRERPHDGEVNYLYGRALVVSGEVGGATFPLRRAMQDEEWRTAAGLQLARAGLGSNDFNEVVEVTTELLEHDPENARAMFFRAQANAYWRKDPEAAIADAIAARELDPDLLEAYEPQILALLWSDRKQEAAEVLAEAGLRLEERSAPESRIAWHCSTTAIFAEDAGDAERARSLWEACLEKHPADVTVVTNAVTFFDARGEFPRSLEALRVAYDEAPGSSAFRNGLATRLRHAGDAAAGEALLREATDAEDPRLAAAAWTDLASYRHGMREHGAAADAFERAVELLREVGDVGPQILFQWADALVVSGQLDRALEVAEEIKVPAQRSLIRGRVAQERGDAARALEEYDEALRLWSNNPWARYYAALAAERLGNFDRALEEYRFSIRIDPAATDARTRVARLLIAEGELQHAYQLLHLQVDVAPLELEGQLLSMYLMARAANPKQLRNALVDLAKREPAKVPAALARGAEGAAETSGAKSAIELLRTAPGIDYRHPHAAPALRELVRLAHGAGEPQTAQAAVDRALAADPEAAVFHEVHGLHLELGGRPAEARAAYTRALEGDSSLAGALLGLGRLAASSDPAEALELFDRATVADPSDPTALLTGARLLRAVGNPNHAARRLDALLDRHPFLAEAAAERVDIDLELGEVTPQTLERARRAARFSRRPEAFQQLGRVYAALGQTERAAQAEENARILREQMTPPPSPQGDPSGEAGPADSAPAEDVRES